MPRPDIHDVRNKHLAETIQQQLFELNNVQNAYQKLSYDEQVDFFKRHIDMHLSVMGLCLLDEDGN